MGKVFHGIPKETAVMLADRYNLKAFVETGTYTARTALWASGVFEQVFTCELSTAWFNYSRDQLNHLDNVTVKYSDSRGFLADVIPALNQPALFWLDAHWSSDLGYRRPSVVCPVLEEIDLINQSSLSHVIMVDDSRLFGVEDDWPDMMELMNALKNGGRRVVTETDEDVVIAVPAV